MDLPPPDPAPPRGHVVPPVTDRSLLLGVWVVGKRCLHYKTSCWAVSSEVARLTYRPYWLWPRATPGATLTGIVGGRSRPCSRPPPPTWASVSGGAAPWQGRKEEQIDLLVIVRGLAPGHLCSFNAPRSPPRARVQMNGADWTRGHLVAENGSYRPMSLSKS